MKFRLEQLEKDVVDAILYANAAGGVAFDRDKLLAIRKKIRNAALDEAVKVALDFHESHGGRSNTAHIVANKIKELKE